MNKRLSCTLMIAGLSFGGLIVLLLLGVQYLRWRQGQARGAFVPPVVQITSPENGLRVPVGGHLPIAGTVFFSPETPVTDIEWWLDGTRLENTAVQPGVDESLSYVHYDLLVPTEGSHLLFLRAVNSQGVIGNSQPITFLGTAKGEAYYAVTLAEGETLEDVAGKYGTDIAALQTLNPDVGSAPAAGTTLKVPFPPEDEPAASAPMTMTESIAPLVPTAPMLEVADISPLLAPMFAASPPQAPTDLQGEVKDCKVKLIWQDNATNESVYQVWMATGGSALTRLAKLQPASGGPAWFEFQAPGPGYFLFWVEAVNSIGTQGSNIIHLNVDSGCPADASTHLQAEILDITVNAAADRIYCYVSFENNPEVRLPAQQGAFITIKNGRGDLTSTPHSYAVSFPQDGSLDIGGECWGWMGDNPGKLGNFAVSSNSETWDGLPIQAHSGAFDVSLSLTPVGQTASDVKYTTANDQPYPYNLRFEREQDPIWPGCEQGCWVLRWDFNPAPKTAADYGLRIFWYDEKHPNTPHDIAAGLSGSSGAQVIGYQGTQEYLYKRFGCEKDIVFEVTTGSDGFGIGTTLGQLRYTLPKCPAQLTVTFDTLELPWTGEGLDPGPCDDLDVYYTLRVNDRRKDFWGGCSFGTGCFLQHLGCGTYSFKELAAPTSDPSPDSFTVPGYDESLALKIVTLFYDYDWGSADDIFAPFIIEHHWPTRAAAEAELGCDGKTFVTDKHVNDTADSILHYTISILPNPCKPYTP